MCQISDPWPVVRRILQISQRNQPDVSPSVVWNQVNYSEYLTPSYSLYPSSVFHWAFTLKEYLKTCTMYNKEMVPYLNSIDSEMESCYCSMVWPSTSESLVNERETFHFVHWQYLSSLHRGDPKESLRNQWALHTHQLNVINSQTEWAPNLAKPVGPSHTSVKRHKFTDKMSAHLWLKNKEKCNQLAGHNMHTKWGHSGD